MQVDNDILERHLNNIRELQSPTGLFTASHSSVATGYNKAWLRDNFYTAMAFEEVGDWEAVKKVYKAIIEIFKKHEEKINWAVDNRPIATYQYIHARYNPETFEEFWEEWGNKQNDCVGEILFKIGEFETKGIKILESEDDYRVVQHLVNYLGTIEYWQDPDNGIWEEYEEVHASSIGACVAGLRSVTRLHNINVPLDLIEKGEEALKKLLPRESKTKFTDLALLSLIYPFNVAGKDMALEIIRHLEYHLERDRGVVRYKNDRYYNKNEDGTAEEAEWCFGFPWLSIIYSQLAEGESKEGDHTSHEKVDYYKSKAKEYLDKALSTVYEGKVPELYYSDSSVPNENTPLAWSESLLVVAMMKN